MWETHSFEDTIAAICTPPGRSGIGIVRISGPEALNVADAIFTHPRKRRPTRQRTFTIAYGHVMDGAEVVDEVILSVMRAPHTYTTQDVVEINCHGGIVPLRRTLELALGHGARLADPGEFTRRAYLFGRIDLAQAEAVADVINAQTEAGLRVAQAQLDGCLSRRVHALREAIVELLAGVEAALDFGDHDIETVTASELSAGLAQLEGEIGTLLATAEGGRLLREGLRIAIVGRPNVGKSSLLNALLGHDRAIVTPIPGTTRDVVEDRMSIEGIAVILADTAGVHQTDDMVEGAGVERTRSAARAADVVLLVLDGSKPLQPEDRGLLAEADGRHISVVNKSDLPQAISTESLVGEQPAVAVSALTGAGLDTLRAGIARMVWSGHAEPNADIIVTNVRHKQALEQARAALTCGTSALHQGATEEYIAENLHEALGHLAAIVGETLPEEVINHIFEQFCIGK